MNSIGICNRCYDPVHRMKDDAVKCVECGRLVHFRCAVMLAAFKRVNEKYPDFVCKDHYGAKYVKRNEETGYTYYYHRSSGRITKKFNDIWINSWTYANRAEMDMNRVHMVECGTPESNMDPIILKFKDDATMGSIEYYKSDNSCIDKNIGKGYSVYDVDQRKDYYKVDFRFRNNKMSNGISLIYNAFLDDGLRTLQRELVPLVQRHSSTFKEYRNSEGVYQINYDSFRHKAEIEYGIILTNEEIDQLINRIKFHIEKGYTFGAQTEKVSQELVESAIKSFAEVTNCMDIIYKAIRRGFGDKISAKTHPNGQINNYIVEEVTVRGHKIKKRIGIA